ncbi:MAG: hypothetical protein NTU59_09900, partial [Coprothermobacterota bacterium]|nr:hypothetical protein [Coprothermobacterota bacterium]
MVALAILLLFVILLLGGRERHLALGKASPSPFPALRSNRPVCPACGHQLMIKGESCPACGNR